MRLLPTFGLFLPSLIKSFILGAVRGLLRLTFKRLCALNCLVSPLRTRNVLNSFLTYINIQAPYPLPKRDANKLRSLKKKISIVNMSDRKYEPLKYIKFFQKDFVNYLIYFPLE